MNTTPTQPTPKPIRVKNRARVKFTADGPWLSPPDGMTDAEYQLWLLAQEPAVTMPSWHKHMTALVAAEKALEAQP